MKNKETKILFLGVNQYLSIFQSLYDADLFGPGYKSENVLKKGTMSLKQRFMMKKML